MSETEISFAQRYQFLQCNDEELISQCKKEPFKGSGPGGQHRNKNLTGIRLHHLPTGIVASASERRESQRNLSQALHRLRLELAVNRLPQQTGDQPELEAFSAQTGAKNPVFALQLLRALHVMVFYHFKTGEAAGQLGISTSSLIKFLKQEKRAWAWVQTQRFKRGLSKLH